jgi:hypothetical protein
MTRIHAASLLVLLVAVPAATAGSYLTSSTSPSPCFSDGNAAYQISGSKSADFIVRIDNAAPSPSLSMQLVDDPATADFVLVDDATDTNACSVASTVKSIRIDPAARAPDLTLALSRKPADYKVYVRSSTFSEQDAAALFAVIWQSARKPGLNREVAARE